MSFSIYLVGFLIVIGGVAWGLILAGVPTVWVIIALIIMVGIGVLTGVGQTRMRDKAEERDRSADAGGTAADAVGDIGE